MANKEFKLGTVLKKIEKLNIDIDSGNESYTNKANNPATRIHKNNDNNNAPNVAIVHPAELNYPDHDSKTIDTKPNANTKIKSNEDNAGVLTSVKTKKERNNNKVIHSTNDDVKTKDDEELTGVNILISIANSNNTQSSINKVTSEVHKLIISSEAQQSLSGDKITSNDAKTLINKPIVASNDEVALNDQSNNSVENQQNASRIFRSNVGLISELNIGNELPIKKVTNLTDAMNHLNQSSKSINVPPQLESQLERHDNVNVNNKIGSSNEGRRSKLLVKSNLTQNPSRSRSRSRSKNRKKGRRDTNKRSKKVLTQSNSSTKKENCFKHF